MIAEYQLSHLASHIYGFCIRKIKQYPIWDCINRKLVYDYDNIFLLTIGTNFGYYEFEITNVSANDLWWLENISLSRLIETIDNNKIPFNIKENGIAHAQCQLICEFKDVNCD